MIRSALPFRFAVVVSAAVALSSAVELATPSDEACSFIALSGVIGDLRARARYLETETRYLERDALALWNGWKSVFGVQDAFPRPPTAAKTPADGSDEQRFQARLFAFRAEASRTAARAVAAAARLDRAEERWAALSAVLSDSGSAGVAREAKTISGLRADVERLAAELNEVDADTISGQAALDRLHPRLQRFVASGAPGALTLGRPWHWTYMVADSPRPILRYDFAEGYEREFEAARLDLAQRRARRQGKAP